MASVCVAVRMRPLNKREKQLSSKKVGHLSGNTITIHMPSDLRKDTLKDKGKSFSYDFLYDSTDNESITFASQERIFHDLGCGVLKAAFEGFNACVFAYGQTGSGKSYTMMGHPGDKGLIPRICEGLFCEMSERSKNDAVSFRAEVSFLEIYNERVRDLLKKRADATESSSLRVREHPRDGPYVENLSTHVVRTHSDMEEMILLGNANRTTASTGMNDFSSRSHAIFTIRLTQAWFDAETPHEMLSKIHLVDLAGSERADATRATGTRLKEGANINKSLVTLGSVISALADLGVGEQTTKKKMVFIPYRDSVLTWLLKDSLGGNSKTTMIATISPAIVNYGETLSTLRYASRAKNIVNSPTVNEDGSVKVIRELQLEVTRLKRLLEEAKKVYYREPSTSEKVEEELCRNEAKVQSLTKEWTCKWEGNPKGEKVAMKSEGSGVVLDCQLPHLIGIDEDLLSTGITLYYLKEGRTLTGTNKASCSQGILLSGPGLCGEHCVFENHAGTVTLTPLDGRLCSVNGSAVTRPCQLTQGAIIRLGSATMFRFNHPSEAAHLREKRQSGLLSDFSPSLTDGSKSAENLSGVMLQNPGKMEEKLKPQEMEWQQVQDSRDIKRLQKKNTGPPHQHGAEEKTKGAAMEETGSGQMDLPPSKLPNSSPNFATAVESETTAIPGRHPAPHTRSELDADALQGGVSTRDGPEQESDPCHKSGPELMSEQPQRRGENGAPASTYKSEEVWSGDGSLQQTSVLGPGDGCGTKPEGNANEIQGVVARCYKGRPGTGGSSLGSVSHPQSTGGTSSMSVLPQTGAHSQLEEKPLNSQAACRPPGETTSEGEPDCGEMDESGGLAEERTEEAAGAAVQSSGLGSLVSRVALIVHDARRLLWSSPRVLQQVCEEGRQPFLAHWSGHVISLARGSKVLSVMKDSQALSMVKESYIVSRFVDSHIFSMVKEMPLIQHIQMEITQRCQVEDKARISQGHVIPHTSTIPLPSQMNFTKVEEEPGDQPLIYEVKHQTLEYSVHNKDVQIFFLPLIELPDSLVKLQKLPFPDLLAALKSILPSSVFSNQKVVALFWLNVAKCSHPEPCPSLLVLMETGLYTLTADSDPLELFHHLPLLQLKEVQIGFAGHGLRLMGSTEESILGVYTHSQRLTRELCWTILGIICPGDGRVSQHPLLQEDWRTAEDGMSLDWRADVPDLLLDAGLRVCCQFQKSLADLVYLVHCNMEEEVVALGEVRVLLYTSVGVCVTSGSRSSPLAQLLLTDTHLGLVREDIVFHPAPRSVSIQPRRPQFHDLTLRKRSDVRLVLMHDEEERGVLRVDVMLANRRAGGHPESVTKASSPPAHASNSSQHAEVWKLTFSCSTEAACLINHLSNV